MSAADILPGPPNTARYHERARETVLSHLLDLAKRGARCPNNHQIAVACGLGSIEETRKYLVELSRACAIAIEPLPRGRRIKIPDGTATWVLDPPPEIKPLDGFPGLVEACEFLREIGESVEQVESNPYVFRINDYPKPLHAEVILRRAANKRDRTGFMLITNK